MKKFLKITGITVLVIIAILFAVPFLFKGKIVRLIKSEINKNIEARVDFDDVDISLLRRFPRVSLSVEELRIVGTGIFSGDTLLSAEAIDVAVDLASVWRGDNIRVYSIGVERPRVHALVARDGSANWDIMKEDSASADTTASEPFSLELKNYTVSNAYILYHDSAAGMNSEIFNLSHSGSGDFTADIFTLTTKTTADAVDFNYGHVPYLAGTRTSIDADIEVDNRTSKYTFTTDEVMLNELRLAAKGFFQLVNDSSYNMDISFNAPSTEFRNILSLIPVVYKKDFDKVETSGKVVFDGQVKGTMSGDKLPAYYVNLDIANAYFQYPDLPSPVKNINIAMKVDNPDGIADHTVVDIPQAHFEIGNDPFNLRLLMKTPVTDMWVDGELKGSLDLSNISRIVKLDKGTLLKGLLNADVSMKGYVEAAQRQQFDRFTAAGAVSVKDFSYISDDYPSGVALNSLAMSFNPKNVTLSNASGRYMNTNFEANGFVNNLLAYTLKNQPLEGGLNVRADRLNVNDWIGSEDSANIETESGPFLVPANLDLSLNAQVDQVRYDNLVMNNVSGSVEIENEALKLDNVQGNALDGTIAVSGSYSTKNNKTKPAIALQYNVQDLDVQKTFNTFNTVQALMPIGKFLGGKLSSKLNLTGSLGSNMLPDLGSLTGGGNILLIQGLLQKFKPLESLADRLQIGELKNISLREVRETFEFNAGKVFVNPFKVIVKDIEMEIGGMHGFDQSMDYTILMKVPRAMLGSQGNAMIDQLAAKASSAGLNLKPGETVNLNVKMLGTISNPDIRLDLKETAGKLADELKEQAKEFVQSKIDSAKKVVTDTLKTLRDEAVKEAAAQLGKQLFGKKDSLPGSDTIGKPAANPLDRLRRSGRNILENLDSLNKKK